MGHYLADMFDSHEDRSEYKRQLSIAHAHQSTQAERLEMWKRIFERFKETNPSGKERT